MLYTTPSTTLYQTIASAYVHRGMTPQDARAKIISMHSTMHIRGNTYRLSYSKIMALMYTLLNTQTHPKP